MAKQQFIELNIRSVSPLVDVADQSQDNEKYKLKRLSRKKDDEVLVFTKKDFKKYSDDNDVVVCGRIRKRQRRYNEYKDCSYDEFVEKKQKKNIIGKAVMPVSEDDEKKYDIKECKNYRHTWGYAWVGDNKFLEVTTFNPFIILIPLLLALLIVLMCHFCQNPASPIGLVDDNSTEKTTQSAEAETKPICYWVPFAETTTLTSEEKSITLHNLDYNKGNYYIIYEVYVDGKLLEWDENDKYHGELMISPSSATVNLYDRLDAGTYELTVIGYPYDWDTTEEALAAKTERQQQKYLKEAKMPVPAKLETHLVIEK